MKKQITQRVYDAAGNELAPVIPGVIHPQLGQCDHSKTRFFRMDGSEMTFKVEKAMKKTYGGIHIWAESEGVSERVAFTMFGKFTWLTQYKLKPKAVTKQQKAIVAAAKSCGFEKQLIADGWL